MDMAYCTAPRSAITKNTRCCVNGLHSCFVGSSGREFVVTVIRRQLPFHYVRRILQLLRRNRRDIEAIDKYAFWNNAVTTATRVPSFRFCAHGHKA